MKFWKKSIAVLSLGFAFIAPSSCVPPDVQAISCTNPSPPQDWHYIRVNPDTSVYFESQAWDPDYSTQRVAFYLNGQVKANVLGVLRYTVPASASGSAYLAKPDYDRCGVVRGWVPYGWRTIQ